MSCGGNDQQIGYFVSCTSPYKYQTIVFLSRNISEKSIASSLFGKLMWCDSHRLRRCTTDPLQHVVEPRILCFDDTVKLTVTIPNDAENLGAHKVHKRKISIPKYTLTLSFSKRIKMHAPILFVENSKDLKVGLELDHVMHFRWGYGLIPLDLGFRLCPNMSVTGPALVEDEGLGFRRENFGNRVNK